MSRRAFWRRTWRVRARNTQGACSRPILKVSGVNVFSAGDFIGAPGTEQLVFSDVGLGIYKKLVIAKGCLVGAVLFGDTTDGLWYVDLIRSRRLESRRCVMTSSLAARSPSERPRDVERFLTGAEALS